MFSTSVLGNWSDPSTSYAPYIKDLPQSMNISDVYNRCHAAWLTPSYIQTLLPSVSSNLKWLFELYYILCNGPFEWYVISKGRQQSIQICHFLYLTLVESYHIKFMAIEYDIYILIEKHVQTLRDPPIPSTTISNPDSDWLRVKCHT